MAIEAKRGCGFRKVGGLYLVTGGEGYPCDRLPIPLTVCPCCSQGIKQSRGWTWLDVAKLVGGIHENCGDSFPCPLCMRTEQMGKAGLLWIGEKFYKTTAEYCAEASQLGISRRIKAIPRGFKVGETWLLLAHPKACACRECSAGALNLTSEGSAPCAECGGSGKLPGIFYVCRPSRIEKIITQTQSQDAELMADLEAKGITPVIVPDDDKDHQGSVYDAEPDEDEVQEVSK